MKTTGTIGGQIQYESRCFLELASVDVIYQIFTRTIETSSMYLSISFENLDFCHE